MEISLSFFIFSNLMDCLSEVREVGVGVGVSHVTHPDVLTTMGHQLSVKVV